MPDAERSAFTALTHSATLRRLLYEALAALRLDPTESYRRAYAGVPLASPLREAREDHDNAPRFWQAIAGISGDADIGLHLAEAMQPRPMDVVGYLLLSAADLRQGLQAFVRFQHILSGGFAARLEEGNEQVRLVIDLNYRGFASLRQQMECLALLLHKMLLAVCPVPLPLLGVEFRHAAPRRLHEHRRLLGVTPLFEQPHDALILPRGALGRPLRSANARLFEVLCEEAQRQLEELVENQLLARVRYWLERNLGQARCDLRSCAAALGFSYSALQRALSEQGSSFRALHDEVRRLKALHLLEQGQAVRDVARACGFAELSPFYRAFHRWQGGTPRGYR
ncbi:AraC family transcriptional regulator ligand-binding domain-containing protein [Pseudomonas sp. NCHU5208]|uniref:AraC family transcriptional regulator n=1 Tax=unclassified Pseudomonas TaxID=196821 RepID=UPI003F9BC1BE